MQLLERTWRLYKQSFNVLAADTEILLFPVISAMAAILVAAGFFVPMYQDGTLREIGEQTATWDDYLFLFLWYYCNYFVVVFFNSALVACANIRLSGGNPGLGDGLRVALHRLGRIAAWALVAATVGLFLQQLSDNRNRALRWVGRALAVSWTLITYLIVPVIVVEDRGVFESIHRSSELFRKHWGEQVTGSFGFGLLNLLLAVPGMLLGWAAWPWDRGAAVILAVVYILILAAVSSAVKGIFTVALYRYAIDGAAPFGFTANSIDPSGGRRG
ncbi:MAG: hypothetical protein IT158_12825 [Bryobacterales bacterium]|nr:hypothetical protein [Bryobacterales bacterium]